MIPNQLQNRLQVIKFYYHKSATFWNIFLSTPNKGIQFQTIVLAAIGYSVVFLIGFFGNALVIFVVWRNKSFHNHTKICLVNLSVADLLLIIVCMPSAIVDLFAKEVWYFGPFLCKVIPMLEHTIANASILTILAVAGERSLAIIFPFKVYLDLFFKIFGTMSFKMDCLKNKPCLGSF